ncbi:hypothetical protein [Cellulomonas hominis]|uniref:hypothetical protein n=1 Tax=Cellulomonas hominis TaxID=156981 RepID=UPI001B96C669|nr:hypothetical protein [Cellulomonas hominis]VTR77239.1 hypothetical protein CHMI_02009 [Cellulomonas hominis]
MTARPARRRPDASSPILAVHVETVRTPASPTKGAGEAAVATPVASGVRGDRSTAGGIEDAAPLGTPGFHAVHGTRPSLAGDSAAPSKGAPDDAPRVPTDYQRGPKATTSLALGVELKSRAETAVLRTSPLPGGARSLTALINEAVARELIRLADELNDGTPFEPNRGAFRMGRPFGS